MQSPLPNNRNNDQQLPRGYVNPGIYQTHDKSSFFEEKELPGSSYIPIDYWNKIMGEGRFKKVIHPLTGKVFNEGGLIDIIQADTPQKPLPAGAAQEEFERHAQHKYTEALKVLMEVNSLPGAKYPGLVGQIEDLRQQGMSSRQIINKLKPTTWGESLWKGTKEFFPLTAKKSGWGDGVRAAVEVGGGLLKLLADVGDLTADIILARAIKSPRESITPKEFRENYSEVAQLIALGHDVSKLIIKGGPNKTTFKYPFKRPPTRTEFRAEFPALAPVIEDWANRWNIFTPDGQQRMRNAFENNPADHAMDTMDVLTAGALAETHLAKIAGKSARISKLPEKLSQKIRDVGKVLNEEIAPGAEGIYGAIKKGAIDLPVETLAFVTETGIDPYDWITKLGGKGVKGALSMTGRGTRESALVLGSAVSQSPIDAARELTKNITPDIRRVYMGEIPDRDIGAPIMAAVGDAWDNRTAEWKSNHAAVLKTSSGQPRNFYSMVESTYNNALKALETLKIPTVTEPKVIQKSGGGKWAPGSREESLLSVTKGQVRDFRTPEIVIDNIDFDLSERPQMRRNREIGKIRKMWYDIRDLKLQADMKAATEGGTPFVDFDQINDLRKSLDLVGYSEESGKFSSVFHGPVRGGLSDQMKMEIPYYRELMDDFRDGAIVLKNWIKLFDIDPKIAKKIGNSDPNTWPTEYLDERDRFVRSVHKLFDGKSDIGKDTLRQLQKYVPDDGFTEDLVKWAAAITMRSGKRRIAGDVPRLMAAMKMLVLTPGAWLLMGGTSPRKFADALRKLDIAGEQIKNIMYVLEQTGTGPFRLIGPKGPRAGLRQYMKSEEDEGADEIQRSKDIQAWNTLERQNYLENLGEAEKEAFLKSEEELSEELSPLSPRFGKRLRSPAYTGPTN